MQKGSQEPPVLASRQADPPRGTRSTRMQHARKDTAGTVRLEAAGPRLRIMVGELQCPRWTAQLAFRIPPCETNSKASDWDRGLWHHGNAALASAGLAPSFHRWAQQAERGARDRVAGTPGPSSVSGRSITSLNGTWDKRSLTKTCTIQPGVSVTNVAFRPSGLL